MFVFIGIIERPGRFRYRRGGKVGAAVAGGATAVLAGLHRISRRAYVGSIHADPALAVVLSSARWRLGSSPSALASAAGFWSTSRSGAVGGFRCRSSTYRKGTRLTSGGCGAARRACIVLSDAATQGHDRGSRISQRVIERAPLMDVAIAQGRIAGIGRQVPRQD
jgi:hypothetical protein